MGYIIKTREDGEILVKCRELEEMDLNRSDKELVKLIKKQLLKDWRKSLLNALKVLKERYTNFDR